MIKYKATCKNVLCDIECKRTGLTLADLINGKPETEDEGKLFFLADCRELMPVERDK